MEDGDGKGRERVSVEAWFSTALDVEEVLYGAGVISCMLWLRMLSSLLTPLIAWSRKAFFFFFIIMSDFGKLAAGLGEPWCRDGGIPEDCPLSMVFIVGLYVSCCRRLQSFPSIKPQLCADNLKCSSVCPHALFGATGFTVQYVRSVGQDVSPGKCVLLSSSKVVRTSMKLLDVSGDGRPWTVELNVRDLGGHLDFTRRARAGTISRRAKEVTHGACCG